MATRLGRAVATYRYPSKIKSYKLESSIEAWWLNFVENFYLVWECTFSLIYSDNSLTFLFLPLSSQKTHEG